MEKGRIYLQHVQHANDCWQIIVRKLFGQSSIEQMDKFGRYLALRQQKLYRLYRIGNLPDRVRLTNIYKSRIACFYEHTLFDTEPQQIATDESDAFIFSSVI